MWSVLSWLVNLYYARHSIVWKQYTVDVNNYVLASSNHDSAWLKNIPYGQFRRVRKNCSEIGEFEKQAEVITERFQKRGYKPKEIKEAREKTKRLERQQLLVYKDHDQIEGNERFDFITQYNPQSKEIKKIIKKHWEVLKLDADLYQQLPSEPGIIFKRATNLKQRVTRSCIPPGAKSKHKSLVGYYPCVTCKACKYGKKTKKFTSKVTNEEFQIDTIIRCTTKNVFYVLECPCGLQYVGKTNRSIRQRLGEHIGNIKKGLETHSVSKHFKLAHNQNPKGLICYGIEIIEPNWRGGDIVRNTLRRESWWIYKLKTLNPLGLNIDYNLRAFL
eukprot:XP_017949155.1 PREDICTED: uncharacterized protein LOC108647467 isoform X1 [Xenopus tropicalis]